jgi:hypothetical protein
LAACARFRGLDQPEEQLKVTFKPNLLVLFQTDTCLASTTDTHY